KSQLAGRIDGTRGAVDAFFRTAERLRFRLLLGRGNELTEATRELQEALDQFYVLKSPDWTKLEYFHELLDDERRHRLRIEVDELLFLWMATIAESLSANRHPDDRTRVPVDRQAVARAVELCEHALTFVEPKEPWRALKARLEAFAGPGEHPDASG